MADAGASIKDWLQAQHDQIMREEKDALNAMSQGNIAEYRKKMQRKAEMLADLSEEAEDHLEPLDSSLREMIRQRLQQFSQSATTALQLDSVFYMSALLYPDEHKKGEPDNLEKFIDSLP